MAPLRKRTRRLLVVASVAAAALVAVAAAYFLRQAQLDRKAREARAAGHAALAAGDARTALESLVTFVVRFGDSEATADDFLAFARARQGVEMPDNRHFLSSIGPLRRALVLDPDSRPAKSALLDAYLATGYTSEALDLVDAMLASPPAEPRLLRVRADLLESLRRFQPALEASREITVRDPEAIDGYFRVFRLMDRTGASGREIETWVESAARARPGDVRFELLRAAMFAQRRDEESARASLDRALEAAAGVNDPEYTLLLVDTLDRVGRFPDSLVVLERAGKSADARVRRELARRLWYVGRAADLRRAAADWERGAVGADPEVAALLLVAPDGEGPSPDAAALRADLAKRVDAVGRAWHALVVHSSSGSQVPRPEAVAALADAVRAVPYSAVMRQALGDAYASLGEADLALAAWTAASERAPSWSRPLLRRARALLVSGRSHLAFSAARGAVARAPGDLEAISTYLDAMTSVVGRLDGPAVESLRRGLETLVREDPSQAADALPMYVEMLCRTDREAAERKLREVLSGGTALSEAALLRLAEVAERAEIPVRDHFIDLAESIHGCTPAVALARAIGRARTSGAPAGLEVLEASRGRSGSGQKVEWDLVRATFLESVGRPESGAAWIEVADAHPTELRAQLGALASTEAWKLRKDVLRVIDRVAKITGDDAVTARIARARWLLDAAEAPEADVAEAARILNEVVRAVPESVSARVLLARAVERLGNAEQAEEQLRIAGDHAPENTWIMLELARIAQLRQRPDAARRQVERLLRSADLEPEQVEKAAYLLAVQGDYRQGKGLLESLTTRAQMRREGMLLLAQLYARLGESARALELCERLLETPDEGSIELAAAIHASTGRKAEAQATLARLDELRIPLSARALVKARHAATWGPPEEARRWFRTAVDAAPGDSGAWLAAAAYAAASGDAAWFRSCFEDPRAARVDAFRLLREDLAALESAIAEPRLRPVVLTALAQPDRREPLVEVLRSVVGDWAAPDRREDVARRTRSAAEANPRVLALQLLAAELCAAVGDVEKACEIADRARGEFPNSSAAARQSAELLASVGRWADALAAGVAWSDRALHDDLPAAVFVAEMLLRTDRPADALARIEPFVESARKRPDAAVAVLVTYGVALARTGSGAPLAALLADLASAGPRWRVLPFQVDARRLGDGKSAALWLGSAASAASDPTREERIARARGWAGAAEAFGDEALLAETDRAIRELRAEGPSAEVEVIAATLAQKRGELESARTGYVRALELDPASIVAMNNLSVVLTDLGRWEEAVELIRRALAAQPDVAELHDTLAYAFAKGGRHAEAVAALADACRLDPTAARFWLAQAESFAAGGDPRSAENSLRRAEDLLAVQRGAPPELRTRVQALRDGLR